MFRMSARYYLCIAAVLLGLFARLWLWWRFIGAADAHIWSQHGAEVLVHGIAHTYQSVVIFNHPPIMGWLAAIWSYFSHGDLVVFSRWLKIPGLIGEIITLALLWRVASPVAAAVYALSPVAILLSGFHGNTDALCAALILAGVVAADRKHWFTAGALFAVGINVKLVPLLLLPILLSSVPWRALPRLAAGLAFAVIPFLPPALSAASAMRENILNYIPTTQDWGVIVFLGHATARDWYVANGRFVVLAVIVLFAIWARFQRNLSVANRMAVGCAIWLVLTPGFGLQYLIYAMPLLCLVDRGYALLWSCSAGAMLAVEYWTGLEAGAHPQTSWIPHITELQPALRLGIVAATVLVCFVAAQLRRQVVPGQGLEPATLSPTERP